MGDPINHPKPILAPRCASREIAIGFDIEVFKNQLKQWMSECVTSRTINRKTGQPWRREIELINDPETLRSINKIFIYSTQGPASMRLGGLTTVTAHYGFGRLSNGQWWVRWVEFSIQGNLSWRPKPEPPIVFNGIPVFVVTESRIQTFPEDLKKGKALLNEIKDNVHKEAKKDAKLMDNPVDPLSAFNPTTYLPTPDSFDLMTSDNPLEELGQTAAEHAFGFEGGPAFQLGKAVVGTWLQGVINNQAGEVARVRRRGYAMFIAGFIETLLANRLPATPPTNKFDRKYFEMGQEVGRRYSDEQKYQIQLALLEWNRLNPPSEWGIRLDEDWIFPDDYKREHSPEMLARSLYDQLYRQKYSVN